MSFDHICWILGWEWINICLEYVSVCWWQRRRLFIAVVFANLSTHPAFSIWLERCDPGYGTIVGVEVGIFLMESVIMFLALGRRESLKCLGISFLMNFVSYATGLLLNV